jgi:hypothetical protein
MLWNFLYLIFPVVIIILYFHFQRLWCRKYSLYDYNSTGFGTRVDTGKNKSSAFPSESSVAIKLGPPSDENGKTEVPFHSKCGYDNDPSLLNGPEHPYERITWARRRATNYQLISISYSIYKRERERERERERDWIICNPRKWSSLKTGSNDFSAMTCVHIYDKVNILFKNALITQINWMTDVTHMN